MESSVAAVRERSAPPPRDPYEIDTPYATHVVADSEVDLAGTHDRAKAALWKAGGGGRNLKGGLDGVDTGCVRLTTWFALSLWVSGLRRSMDLRITANSTEGRSVCGPVNAARSCSAALASNIVPRSLPDEPTENL
jgi:hypothetical protein